MANEYLNNKTFEAIIGSFQHFARQKTKYELIINDVKETHDRRKKKYNDNSRHEILKDNLEEQKIVIHNYKDNQEKLAYAFYVLSENIANYSKFSGIDIDDAVQEGVLICFEKIDRFDHRKGKAFNYMTTCILNHYRQLYRSARNYNELKKRYAGFLQSKFESLFYMNKNVRPNNNYNN